jgi:hypothetical protein
MKYQAEEQVPQWKVNARIQVHQLAKEKLIRFMEMPLQSNDLIFKIGPLTAALRISDTEIALQFRCLIGEVSDTHGVSRIYEYLPMQGLNLEYELKPISKVHASSQMPLSDDTSSAQIYAFAQDCSLLSMVGLQSLIHLGNLITPSPTEIEHFQLGPGQDNWGNPGIAIELLRE